jgi:hypothetical protein
MKWCVILEQFDSVEISELCYFSENLFIEPNVVSVASRTMNSSKYFVIQELRIRVKECPV